MIFLVGFEIFMLFTAFGNLIAVRTLIVGEGHWTKAQKDAVHSLYLYSLNQDSSYIQNFLTQLKIIEGDRLARIELLKDHPNYKIVRDGFVQGQVEENEVGGIIKLLQRFKGLDILQNSLLAWSQADDLVDELHSIGMQMRSSKGDYSHIKKLLARVGEINSSLSLHEKVFSRSLIEASRWMEKIIIIIVASTVIFFETIAIFLVIQFGKYLVQTINNFKSTAQQVGRGNFLVSASKVGRDELGQLGDSLNIMINNLKMTIDMQRRTEESLRRSNEKFSIMVEAVKDYSIFGLDLNGCVRTWNSGAEHINGYPADEIIGHHFSIFYVLSDLNDGLPEKELALAKKYLRYEREALRLKKDGTKFWAHVTLNARYNKDGRISGFTMVTRDITERKEYELQLQKNNNELEKRIAFRTKELQWRESQLRQITNALPEAVCQVDRNETFLYANESFWLLFRKNQHEIIGRKVIEILGADFYKSFEKPIQNTLKGELTSFEFLSKNETDSFDYNITLVPDFDEKNVVIGFVLVAHNIKKYKEIEFELKKSKVLADVANQTKSAFLANMSHEIRTPLGAILGYSELIINDEVSDSQKMNIAEAIKRNGQLLSNVINDILDLSKVEAGKLEIEKVNILLEDIIKDIDSLLSLKANEKGIQLLIETENNMPLAIKTDPLRLRQILLNVVGNAIKFTQQGVIKVKINFLYHPETKSSQLEFVVIDSGLGISAEQIDKLFRPFSQADISTTRKYGGSGLGLILSKKLANSLGGDVILKTSEIGKGSTFTITVDAGISQMVNLKKFEPIAPQIKSNKDEMIFDFNNLKILIVEDSYDNQIIISHFLKATGAVLKIAQNGQEALDMALAEKFDIILLDLQMPVMGGFETIKILNEKNYNVPVIALTAHAMKEDRKQCLQAGFKDHMSKPINRLSLLRVIYFWTHKKSETEIELI